MAGSTISNTVTNTVTLGVGGYASPLTITDTGDIAPLLAGADAIVDPAALAHRQIINDGTVAGAVGSGSLLGGIGIDLAASAAVINSGRISGGSGNIGVNFAAGGRLSNSGAITGGAGPGYSARGGGTGVWAAGDVQIANSGTIAGGYGGVPQNTPGDYAPGGTGIYLASAGTVINTGRITGGSAAYYDFGSGAAYNLASGSGVDLASGGKLFNNGGFIAGGTGGMGVSAADGATIVNTGEIQGGVGASSGFSGTDAGTGVKLTDGGTLINDGGISGGEGGFPELFPPLGAAGSNAPGVILTNGGTVINTGFIAGGPSNFFRGGEAAIVSYAGGTVTNSGTLAGGFGGGGGIDLQSGGDLTNRGVITGASGFTNYFLDGTGGGGGVSLAGNADGFNSGTITAGAGGQGLNGEVGEGFPSYYNPGGNGGTGVSVSSGGTFTNAGTITGGAGGYGTGSGGVGGIGVGVTNANLVNHGFITGGAGAARGDSGFGSSGGAGVYLNGGTLITTGDITGGLDFGGLSTADAVQFGTLAGELIIVPGAVFNGAVAANAAVADVLALAGNTPGTLSGLGTAFTGFSILVDAMGADWTFSGSNTLGSATNLEDHGFLSVTGSLEDAGHAIVLTGSDLQASGTGAVQIAGVTLDGGTVACSTSASFSVGTTPAINQAGAITLESGATLVGFGAADAARIVDDGHIAASGGTLVLGGAVSGTGALAIDSGATLAVTNGLSVAHMVFLAGGDEVLRTGASPITSTLSGFGAGDVIDIRPLVATTLTFLAGTLTLLDGTTPVDSLDFAGTYTAANFSLAPDDHGGTNISFLATSEPALWRPEVDLPRW